MMKKVLYMIFIIVGTALIVQVADTSRAVMKKLLFIITFILMIPTHVFAANLTDITPQQFIEYYNRQVKQAFKGLSAPYQRYKQNFIIYDVAYLPDKNCYIAVVDTYNTLNVIWIDIGDNNGIKRIEAMVSNNNPDLMNVLFHYMDLITNAIGMYGVLNAQELENVIKGHQDLYVFNYRGNKYTIMTYEGVHNNIKFTAIDLAAY